MLGYLGIQMLLEKMEVFFYHTPETLAYPGCGSLDEPQI
jgi:hypothetical protein